MQRLLSIQRLRSLLFNLLFLPNLLERSTYRVDRDSNLAIEGNVLGGFRKLREGVVCGEVVDDWERDRAEPCKEAEY